MKAKKGFKLRPLGNEYILVGEGIEQVNFNKMITMNETAAFVWEKAAAMESFTAEDMAEMLCAEYEVSAEQALADAKATAQSWLEAGIAE